MRSTGRAVSRSLKGAVAGAGATWAMGKLTSYLYENEPKRARAMEDRARNGGTSYGTAADKLAHIAGVKLTKKERRQFGEVIHWAIGVGAGAVYSELRKRMPGRLARGILFGTALWLLTDEGATYVFGLTPGPGKFPWQTHARGLAGHLVFGIVADAALSVL